MTDLLDHHKRQLQEPHPMQLPTSARSSADYTDAIRSARALAARFSCRSVMRSTDPNRHGTAAMRSANALAARFNCLLVIRWTVAL
jgi:hypothetical protein